MRAIQENEMAEPGPRGLRRGLWGRQQSRSHKVTMHTNPSTPGCPAWRALELPLAQCGGTAPRSFARPWPRPRPGLADPRRFLQPPPARLESLTRSPDSQQHPTPSSPDESPACVLGGGPHASLPGTHVPPPAKLTRPGVFLRSFSCSPRRLSRGGQPGSLHLPVRSPPFFTSPTSPDLVVEGGARDEGGA